MRKSDKKLGQNSFRSQFSDARQLGCVFQDMTPPKSVLRKSTDMPKPIQRVNCAAIGASRQTIMAEYDARTDEALCRLASTLPTATALDLLAKLDEAYAESHFSWQNVLSGSEPAMRDQPMLLVMLGASRLTTMMAMMSIRTRANAPRFRASSLRTSIPEFVRACCKCMRVKAPGPLACASLSLATPLWITRGCGDSTFAMARHWKLTSTSTRFAFAHALPATQAFWTRARRTPPAAPSVRPRVVTTLSPPFSMQPRSSAITPLKWRFLASFLART